MTDIFDALDWMAYDWCAALMKPDQTCASCGAAMFAGLERALQRASGNVPGTPPLCVECQDRFSPSAFQAPSHVMVCWYCTSIVKWNVMCPNCGGNPHGPA